MLWFLTMLSPTHYIIRKYTMHSVTPEEDMLTLDVWKLFDLC